MRECKEYAERNDIGILETYIDRAASAKTEFQHMIKDSAKGLFDIVLVWKLDRFAPNRYDSARYKNFLEKNGVKVISARENIFEGSEGTAYKVQRGATMQEHVNLLNSRGMCSIRGGKITQSIRVPLQMYLSFYPMRQLNNYKNLLL